MMRLMYVGRTKYGNYDYAVDEKKRVWSMAEDGQQPYPACSCCAVGSIIEEVVKRIGAIYTDDESNPPSKEEWKKMIEEQRKYFISNELSGKALYLLRENRFADLETFCKFYGLNSEDWIKFIK